MLSEEAIVVIAALGAAALFIVALLEVVWPTRGRRPGRRARYPRRRGYRRDRRRIEPRLARSVARPLPHVASREVAWPRAAAASPAPPNPAGPPREPVTPPPPVAPYTVPATTSPVLAAVERVEPTVVDDPPAHAPVDISAEATIDVASAPLEQCFELYEQQRFAEVVDHGTRALEAAVAQTSEATTAHEQAALWSLVGLSKQALGDEEEARAALEHAVRVAPAPERPAYQRHLGALALTVGRKCMARAELMPETAGHERLAALRSAVMWFRQGLAAVLEDETLAHTLARARQVLWDAYRQLAMAFIQRQEFPTARRLVREALAMEDLPDDRCDAFRELLATTFSGEIGQLTAHAIRVMQGEHEREALAALQRAEALLGSIPDEALTPKRRLEVNRRLWWGYTQLGVRRVESGQFEDALEPLFHALKIGEAEPAGQQETRTALVRALESVTEARAESIDQLLQQGQRDAAVEESVRLRRLLREGLEVGLSRTDLTHALTKTRLVLEQVEQAP
jgi:tetratricopeptide (TPR) repeat protein